MLAIVSGPEPQRSIFEQKLRNQLKNKKALLVLGKPEKEITETYGDLRIVSHLNGEELNQAMDVNFLFYLPTLLYTIHLDLMRKE